MVSRVFSKSHCQAAAFVGLFFLLCNDFFPVLASESNCKWVSLEMPYGCPLFDSKCSNAKVEACLPIGVGSSNGNCFVPLCKIGGYDWSNFPQNFVKAKTGEESARKRNAALTIIILIILFTPWLLYVLLLNKVGAFFQLLRIILN